MTDGIILLHGIFRTSLSMRGLARFLKKGGYDVLNVNYRSTKYSLQDIVERIHPKIEKFIQEDDGKIHFVGYSMGGLVARAYITKYRPANLGRVVMLGTPNQGSELADRFIDWKFYKWSYGPAGQQLITDQSAFAHVLGKADYEAGVLAGNCSLDPIASWMLGKPNDGKVTVDSTKLEGMKDHIVVPVTHTFLPHRRLVWKRAAKFIKDGLF